MKIEELFHQYKSNKNPVVGVIIEPIQSEGGDYHGSPAFFQQLQKLTKKVRWDEEKELCSKMSFRTTRRF